MNNKTIKKKMLDLGIQPEDIKDRLGISLSTVYRRLQGDRIEWAWRQIELAELKRMFEEAKRK
jgi:predicted transcriptional regulator